MSYVNYHDMVQELEAANPLTSWQSYAPSVQDGAMLSLGRFFLDFAKRAKRELAEHRQHQVSVSAP